MFSILPTYCKISLAMNKNIIKNNKYDNAIILLKYFRLPLNDNGVLIDDF